MNSQLGMMSNNLAANPETICRFCLSHKQQAVDFYDINQETLDGGSLSIREAVMCCTKVNMSVRSSLFFRFL